MNFLTKNFRKAAVPVARFYHENGAKFVGNIYLASNVILLTKIFQENGNWQDFTAGAFALGASVSVRQSHKYPRMYNVCGGFVLGAMGMLFWSGMREPGFVQHTLSVVPSFLTGLIMLADTQHKQRNKKPVDDQAKSSLKKWFQKHSRLVNFMPLLLVSRPLHIWAGILQGDPLQVAYALGQGAGDTGIISTDPTIKQQLKILADSGNESENGLVPE